MMLALPLVLALAWLNRARPSESGGGSATKQPTQPSAKVPLPFERALRRPHPRR